MQTFPELLSLFYPRRFGLRGILGDRFSFLILIERAPESGGRLGLPGGPGMPL